MSYKKLIEAIERDDLPALKKLLASGVPPRKDKKAGKDDRSPLAEALISGRSEMAQALLDAGADPNEPDPASDGLPLAQALASGLFDVAELLLQKGADPKGQNEYSSTLSGAVASGSVEWVEWLLAEGADRTRRDHNRNAVLASATYYPGRPEMLRALWRLGLKGSDAQVEALWSSVVSHDDPATVGVLLELGGVPSQRDLLHVLSVAVSNRRLEATKLLLAHLEDKDACTDPTWSLANGNRGPAPNTLLGRAVFECSLDLVKLLLDAGADPAAGPTVETRRERGAAVVPAGTSAVGMAELRKKELAKAREAHFHPDLEPMLALLKERAGPAAKKPASAKAGAKEPKAAKKAKGASAPEYKVAIDAELRRLARKAGGDEDGVQAALDAVDAKGGPWAYLERVLRTARDPLFEGDIPKRLERTLLGRLLSDDPFDGDGPPSVYETREEAGEDEEGGNVVYLEFYPKKAKKPLRDGEVIAASGADVWVLEPLEGGDARFSHAHPEGFWVLAKGAVELVKKQVEKALG